MVVYWGGLLASFLLGVIMNLTWTELRRLRTEANLNLEWTRNEIRRLQDILASHDLT